jgi:hypothetical protein
VRSSNRVECVPFLRSNVTIMRSDESRTISDLFVARGAAGIEGESDISVVATSGTNEARPAVPIDLSI